jgi:hypothetical protein
MSEEDWLDSGFPIVMFESRIGWPTPRKQRLFAVACCRSVQHAFPEGPGWAQSLDLAERVADRKAKVGDLAGTLAHAEAWRGLHSRRNSTNREMRIEMVQRAIRWACENSRRAYAGQAAIAAGAAAAYATLPVDEPYIPPAESKYRQQWWDAEKEELVKQIHLLRDICGDDFRPIEARIAELPPHAKRIALSAYDERLLPTGHIDAQTLAVLSDALEEAGAADALVLSHLRSAGPHVRGCWALDLVLARK